MKSDLLKKISYQTKYFNSVDELIEQIKNKTVIPYQVELQPGRLKGKSLCWMSCSYCYGASSENKGERLTKERYLEIIDELCEGNRKIKKIIFAGYATDPLNCEYIDDLIERAVEHNVVIGIHTKLLKISDRLVDILSSDKLNSESYITVSVDAGDDLSYNLSHGLPKTVKVYQKVLNNIKKLTDKAVNLDISSNYLITKENHKIDLIESGIKNLINVGIHSIRFSFPQIPRGQENPFGVIDIYTDIKVIEDEIRMLLKKFNNTKTDLSFISYEDGEENKRRTLPCLARFIYPAVSFEGTLSHCSQSAAPQFDNMMLGKLQNTNFWDAFYDYDPKDFLSMLNKQHEKMNKNDCRCDRKEHKVNSYFKEYYENISNRT